MDAKMTAALAEARAMLKGATADQSCDEQQIDACANVLKRLRVTRGKGRGVDSYQLKHSAERIFSESTHGYVPQVAALAAALLLEIPVTPDGRIGVRVDDYERLRREEPRN